MPVNVRYQNRSLTVLTTLNFRQVVYDASLDVYLTSKTIHNARPGVWTSPENILALYKAVELFVGQRQNLNGKERWHLNWTKASKSEAFRVKNNSRWKRGRSRYHWDAKIKTKTITKLKHSFMSYIKSFMFLHTYVYYVYR